MNSPGEASRPYLQRRTMVKGGGEPSQYERQYDSAVILFNR